MAKKKENYCLKIQLMIIEMMHHSVGAVESMLKNLPRYSY